MTFVGEWATGLGVHICLTKHSCHRQRVPRKGRGNRLLQVQMFSQPEPASGIQAAGSGGQAQCSGWWDEAAGRTHEQKGRRRLTWSVACPQEWNGPNEKWTPK